MDLLKYLDLAKKHRSDILETESYLWKNPETGYREWNTTRHLAEIFTNAGYQLHMAGNIPGFYTDLDTGSPGPRILIMGEMDCLIQPKHPAAVDGKAHSCGHHAQCAALVGVALALKEPGALDGLCGSIRLMAVPAEEMIELEFRNTLRDQGIIRYLGGKTEFLYRGFMDGCDMAYLLHAACSDPTVLSWHDFIGCMTKQITYTGVAAHAGSAPDCGINALYAANLGLQAINSLRETFRDDEHIRVHPIMTEGGSVVNTIPDAASISTYIRGAELTSIAKTNRKVSRAAAGSALCIGAKVSVRDRPGYAPLKNSRGLVQAACEVGSVLFGADRIDPVIHQAFGSTDMGDLSCLMPVFQANIGGCRGDGHSDDFVVEKPELTCVMGAAMYLMLTAYLLENGAERAKQILCGEKPQFASKKEYFSMIDQFLSDRDLITYMGNSAQVTFGEKGE